MMQRDVPANLSAGTPENVLARLRTELSLVHECFDEHAQRFPRGSGLLELPTRRSWLHARERRLLERFHPCYSHGDISRKWRSMTTKHCLPQSWIVLPDSHLNRKTQVFWFRWHRRCRRSREKALVRGNERFDVAHSLGGLLFRRFRIPGLWRSRRYSGAIPSVPIAGMHVLPMRWQK